jgi:hypothetical protein
MLAKAKGIGKIMLIETICLYTFSGGGGRLGFRFFTKRGGEGRGGEEEKPLGVQRGREKKPLGVQLVDQEEILILN